MVRSLEKKIVVIGAGISGLSAAYELSKKGYRVEVFEKEGFVGGRMHTEITEDGLIVDTGAQTLHDPKVCRHTFRLIHEIGVSDQLIKFDLKAAVLRDGQIFKMPSKKLGSLMKLQWISRSSQLKILKLIQSLALNHRKFDFGSPENWLSFDRESVEQYVLREFGKEFLDYFINPLLRPHTMGDLKDVSLIYLFWILKADFFHGHRTFKKGIGYLPAKIAEKCIVHVHTEVKKVSIKDGRARGIRIEREGNQNLLEADAVICTVPAPVADTIAPDLPHEMKVFLKNIKYAKIPIIVFGLNKKIMKDLVAITIPQKEGLKTSVVFENRNKYLGTPSPSHGAMVCWSTDQDGRLWMQLDDEAIYAQCKAELQSFLPDFPGEPLFKKIYKKDHALPQYWPGQVAASQKFKAENAVKGLFFAGDYLSPAMGIEGAVITGLRAAEETEKFLMDASSWRAA